MDWYAKSPTDYRNDTWGISLAAHGAYNLLIDHYMLYEAPLPADDHALSSIIGQPVEEWLLVKDEVLKFFTRRGEKLHHKRCNAELNSAYTKRKDGAARQKKYRKRLNPLVDVTHQSHVSNAPTGQDRTVHIEEPPIPPKGAPSEDLFSPTKKKKDSNLKVAEKYVEVWNDILGSIHKVSFPISATRVSHLRARVLEMGGPSKWKEYLEHITTSDFLMGKVAPGNGREEPFRLSFDWAINPTNFQKIIEGRYHPDKGNGEDKPLTKFEAEMKAWYLGGQVGPKPTQETAHG